MDISFYSEIGGRNKNEDSIFKETSNGKRIFIVCDGLGGHGGGDIASKTACRIIAQQFFESPRFDTEEIGSFLQAANESILATNQGGFYAKTTVAALFICNNQFICAHIGDSRVYRFSSTGLLSKTTDHSVPQMAVLLGEIEENQIRNHPDRNKVLQVLGAEEQIHPTVTGGVLNGMNAFLLCTDGFWEYVYDEEMYFDLTKSDSAEKWLNNMRLRHIQRAPKDCDNNSAIAVILP